VAKVTRKRLARGTKLYTEQVHELLDDIVTEWNAGTIEREQLQADWAPWSVSYNIPFIDSLWQQNGDDRMLAASHPTYTNGHVPYCFPLAIPPTQDYFDQTGSLANDTPIILLDEVTFSFDQRDEAAALTDSYLGSDAQPPVADHEQCGLLHYGLVDRYEVKISIMGRRPTYIRADAAADKYLYHTDPEAWGLEYEVWSTTIPSTAYSTRRIRQNPFSYRGIRKALNPYHTYVVVVSCPGLFDGAAQDDRIAMVNPTITLKGRTPLIGHDVNVAASSVAPDVQNMPPHYGVVPTGFSPLAITTPAGDSSILADGAGGISTEYEKVDRVLRGGAHGGYTNFSDVPGWDYQIADDAAWGIIAVPMFQNKEMGEINFNTVRRSGGASTGPPYTHTIYDRYRLKVPYAMVVHHVIACVNYQTTQSSATYIRSNNAVPDVTHTVNVAVSSGLRADDLNHQDMAYAQWAVDLNASGTRHDELLIDRIAAPGTIKTDPPGSGGYGAWMAWELISVPLVKDTDTSIGTGYDQAKQGKPFFVGPALRARDGDLRTNVGIANAAGSGGAGVQPATNGSDQYLTFRWSIAPTVNWTTVDTNAGGTNDCVFMGYQGAWILLIVKRHLT